MALSLDVFLREEAQPEDMDGDALEPIRAECLLTQSAIYRMMTTDLPKLELVRPREEPTRSERGVHAVRSGSMVVGVIPCESFAEEDEARDPRDVRKMGVSNYSIKASQLASMSEEEYREFFEHVTGLKY